MASTMASLAFIALAVALSGGMFLRYRSTTDQVDLRMAIIMLAFSVTMPLLRSPSVVSIAIIVLIGFAVIEVGIAVRARRVIGRWCADGAGHYGHAVLCLIAMATMLIPMAVTSGPASGEAFAEGNPMTMPTSMTTSMPTSMPMSMPMSMSMSGPGSSAVATAAAILCLSLICLSTCVALAVHALSQERPRLAATRTLARLLVAAGMAVPALALL